MDKSDNDENTRNILSHPLETASGLPGNTENASRLDNEENLPTPDNVIGSRRSKHRRSASVQSPTFRTIEKFSKYIPQPFSTSRFNNAFPDQSEFRPGKEPNVGLKAFLTELISEIDKYLLFIPNSANIDSKTSSFHERLGLLKHRRQKKKENSTESPKDLIKQEINEEASEVSVINKSPFFDENKERRCSRFLSGQPCSSQCKFLHRYPKDDGVLCKYYYLHMECPRGCKYLHERKCSKETWKRYQDKHTSKRCLLYLYKDCKDISCQKLHRLPKEDNIYCFKQLSLECSKGSDCIHKHREDLQYTTTVPSNTAVKSLQCSPNVKDVKVENITTMDEDIENPSHSCSYDDEREIDDDRDISDTDSDNCAPEYYIPDSDPEDHFPKYDGVGLIVNILRSSKEHSFGSDISENRNKEFSNRENAHTLNWSDHKYEYPYSNKSVTGAYGDTVRCEVSSSSTKYEESLNSDKRHVEGGLSDTVRLSQGDKNSVNIKKENNIFDLDLLKSERFSCESTKKEISKYPDDESQVTSSRDEISVEESPDIQLIDIKKEIPVYDLSSDDEEQEPCRQKPRLNENVACNVKSEVEEESTLPTFKPLKLDPF